MIKDSLKRASQWLMVPITVPVLHSKKEEPYFMVYTSTQVEVNHNVYRLSDAINIVIKQIKEAVLPYHGVMNQVTVHVNKANADAKQVVKRLTGLVSNASLLDVEPIDPYLMKVAGTKNAMFISVI